MNHLILYCTVLYYTILCYAMLCYTILYYTVNYTIYYILYYTSYTMLCYAILCYTVLYYTTQYICEVQCIRAVLVQYCTVLYTTYYTMLYYAMLYYTIQLWSATRQSCPCKEWQSRETRWNSLGTWKGLWLALPLLAFNLKKQLGDGSADKD